MAEIEACLIAYFKAVNYPIHFVMVPLEGLITLLAALYPFFALYDIWDRNR
jgi:hypothetical protein